MNAHNWKRIPNETERNFSFYAFVFCDITHRNKRRKKLHCRFCGTWNPVCPGIFPFRFCHILSRRCKNEANELENQKNKMCKSEDISLSSFSFSSFSCRCSFCRSRFFTFNGSLWRTRRSLSFYCNFHCVTFKTGIASTKTDMVARRQTFCAVSTKRSGSRFSTLKCACRQSKRESHRRAKRSLSNWHEYNFQLRKHVCVRYMFQHKQPNLNVRKGKKLRGKTKPSSHRFSSRIT